MLTSDFNLHLEQLRAEVRDLQRDVLIRQAICERGDPVENAKRMYATDKIDLDTFENVLLPALLREQGVSTG